MRRYLIAGACIICITISLLLLMYTGTENPVVYSIEKENPVSPYHADIEAQKRVDINTTLDVLPVMQDLLDFSGTITVNIRMKDLESANTELSEYSQKIRSFNSLVVKLDMNESEIGTFKQDKQKQGELYRQIINQSESLDALNKLEIRYRDEKDSSALNSVMLQGEALKKKIQSVRNEYTQVSEKIENQSKKIGLDTKEEIQGRQEIDQYVRDVTDEQEERVKRNQNLYIDNKPRVSLLVEPTNGTYRTVLKFNGFISGGNISNSVIYIYLDGEKYIQAIPDNIGQYRVQKEIEKVPAGMHILNAKWRDVTSENQKIKVTTTNSTLTLGIKAEKNRPVIIVSGTLTTNESPVRYAPLDINANNQTVLSPVTNWRGMYGNNLSLSKGTYLVDASFSNSSYPVNASRSELYEVISSGTSITSIRKLTNSNSNFPTLILGIVVVLIIISGTGVVFFLYRRRKKVEIPDIPREPEESPGIELQKVKLNESEEPQFNLKDDGIKDPGEGFLGAYVEKCNTFGLSDASHYVYLVFLVLIGKDTQLKLLNIMTPREVAARIHRRPYGEVFGSFIQAYEEIRYGGYVDDDHRLLFEELMARADKAIRGGR